MSGTAIALSGGGHRASIFGLGVLIYLVDSERHRDVVSIASVSGGSITNAFVAQEADFAKVSVEQFERAVAAPLAERIARRGIVFAWPWTWLFLAGLAIAACATIVVPWLVPLSLWARLAVMAVAVPLLGWLTWQRGRVCRLAYAKRLLCNNGKPTALADVGRSVHHVICATDLRTGRQVYFAPDFIYGYSLGCTHPGRVDLSTAVQASAAVPGGFPPLYLSTRALAFADTKNGSPSKLSTNRLVLADGGVYDNMADEWALGFHNRLKRWPALVPGHQEPDTLIVVNSASREDWVPYGRKLPVWAEVAALIRDMNVLYENTTAMRRKNLVSDFNRAESAGQGMSGGLIMLNQSPRKVAGAFARDWARKRWPARHSRAQAVLARLDEAGSPEEWQELTDRNCAVRTTLRALGVETSAELLRHAYVLAMSNLHVLLDYPLLKIPSYQRFAMIARGRGTEGTAVRASRSTSG